MTRSAEIKVMSSAATREAYLQLVPAFERESGHRVTTQFVPTVDMMTRLKSGEVVDLVIMASESIDELVADGRIVPGRTDLVRSSVGVAVKKGAPKPDISTADALKRALLAAESICYSAGPSGVYIAALLQRMGIADDVKARVKQVKGIPVGEIIARGEVGIGFQQVSELLPVAGIEFVGPLPAEIQQNTVFSAGLHGAAKEVEAARALVQFLTSPGAAPVFRKLGLEPV